MAIATPQQMTYTVPWNAEVPEDLDRMDFASLTLSVVVRGYNVLHGGIQPRNITLTVPTCTASFDGRVEVAVDGGPFSSDGVTVDLNTWATTIAALSEGTHTIRAHAVQGWMTSRAASRTVT